MNGSRSKNFILMKLIGVVRTNIQFRSSVLSAFFHFDWHMYIYLMMYRSPDTPQSGSLVLIGPLGDPPSLTILFSLKNV